MHRRAGRTGDLWAPVGVAIGPDGSLLVADDVGNAIWHVTSEQKG
jgi:glucose/arabinose dehydrogenase